LSSGRRISNGGAAAGFLGEVALAVDPPGGSRLLAVVLAELRRHGSLHR